MTREVLDRFERQVHAELRKLDDIIASLRREPGLEVFPLNETMLERAVDLCTLDLSLKPFDQAILAAVLVRAEELRRAGEAGLCFCETDSDLQPWDKHGDVKRPLTYTTRPPYGYMATSTCGRRNDRRIGLDPKLIINAVLDMFGIDLSYSNPDESGHFKMAV